MGLFNAFSKKISSVFDIGKEERKLSLENLEDILISSDFGTRLSMEMIDTVEKIAKEGRINSQEDLKKELKNILMEKVSPFNLEFENNRKTLILMLGVNGTGKTTSCAKLANYYKKNGKSVLLAPADTFRAAAEEQLVLHAQKIGVRIITNPNASGPAAVVFDAIDSANSKGENLIICDTAGRMHTKENLMRELSKVDKVVSAKMGDASSVFRFLVLDATTGQNALNQADSFINAVHIDAIIATKMDSLAKGGGILRIAYEYSLPIAFVCSGEGYDDISPFNKDEFIDSLLDV